MRDFSSEVGDRLAALSDGEACFYIGQINRRKPGGGSYNCSFRIKLRDDDRPFLEKMQSLVGLGRIYTHRDGPTNPNPCVTWAIDSKKECEELVDIFDRFPLWSKKARDFKIWRDAVLYWNYPYVDDDGKIVWDEMDQCRRLLMAGRAYRAPLRVVA